MEPPGSGEPDEERSSVVEVLVVATFTALMPSNQMEDVTAYRNLCDGRERLEIGGFDHSRRRREKNRANGRHYGHFEH